MNGLFSTPQPPLHFDSDAFRLALSDALRPLTDPGEIKAAAAQVLGKYLAVNRTNYIEVLPGEKEVIVELGYTDGVSVLSGRFSLEEYGRNLTKDHIAGQTLVESDIVLSSRFTEIQKAALKALDIAAFIDVPLIKNGQFVGLLVVHQAITRQWTNQDVALVEETAERTWEAVERARAEAALRKSEARYRTLFESIDEGFCILQLIFDEQQKPIDYRYIETNPVFEQQLVLQRHLAIKVLPFQMTRRGGHGHRDGRQPHQELAREI